MHTLSYSVILHNKWAEWCVSSNDGGRQICTLGLMSLHEETDDRFHCFTGAVSNSSFFKISNKEWFLYWPKFPKHEEFMFSISKPESLSNRNDNARSASYLTKVFGVRHFKKNQRQP